MSAIGLAKDTITSWVSPILRYERHLSALAFQTRADERKAALFPAATHLARDGSVSDAMAALPPENGALEHATPTERWRKYLPAATQFALGGLWSGFLVFYSRSASLTASWLFLGTLVAFLFGNEVFRKYHSRLVFAVLLLFFATYSYAVFTVPVVTRTIGKLTFLASGAVAILVFLLFVRLLSVLGRKRLAQA